MTTNILVTACGSIGGINFVNSLRSSSLRSRDIRIVGTDHFPLNARMCDVESYYWTPSHDSKDFIPSIKEVCDIEKIDFIHPSVESEARVIGSTEEKLGAKTFLPNPETLQFCRDKFATSIKLFSNGALSTIPADYKYFKHCLEIYFLNNTNPLWIRQKIGAGGRGSLKCDSADVARKWVDLLVTLGKAKEEDFFFQPFLSGDDYAFDSIWFEGELAISFTRKRLSYLFPHLSMSGVTGTPTASMIVHDKTVNITAVEAIKTVDPKPHGVFCVDLKGDDKGNIFVTEINCKPHSTMFLWGIASDKAGNPFANLALYYVDLGLNGTPEGFIKEKFDCYPDKWTLLRTIDAGVFLVNGNRVVKVK